MAGMSHGCRDCTTCTRPAATRWGIWWALAFLYACTAWIPWVVKRGVMRHCPRCHHLLGSHQRRADRSFID